MNIRQPARYIDLEQWQDNFPDSTVKCHYCEGTGEVEWEFHSHTKDGTCPECGGSGRRYSTEAINYLYAKDVFTTAKKLSSYVCEPLPSRIEHEAIEFIRSQGVPTHYAYLTLNL